jgi:hypothetical protein
MKQFKLILSSLFVLLVVNSCKKQNTAAPVVDNSPKLAKIEYVGSNNVVTYTYNADGRLIENKNNYYTEKTDYASGTPVVTGYITATGVKDYSISGITLNGGKITNYSYYLHDAQGQTYGPVVYSFEYDANGFQVKGVGSSHEYLTEVTNRNMTKQSIRNKTTGLTDRTYIFEFYTDKPNKLNLNFFEVWYGQIMFDKNLMGAKNSNLFKKITYTSGSRTEVTDFTYVTNADGYVTEYTTSKSVNGAAPVVSTAKLTYQ